MKANRLTYRAEKSTLRDYFWALKGIQIPWIFLLLIFASSLGSTFAALNISFFTGDMVDAQGNVPTTRLIKYVLSYGGMGLAAAAITVFSALASERINLGLRTKLWRKIMYTRQSCYDRDGGSSLVSRVTADCDFASKLLTTIASTLSICISLGIYVKRMYKLNGKIATAMMILIPVSVLVGWGYAKLRFLIAQKSQAMLSRTTTYLVERTRSIPLIKTANAQAGEIENGEVHFRQQYNMQIKTGLMDVAYSFMQTAFRILGIFIPFVIGAKLVSDGIIRVGVVVVFYNLAGTVSTTATNFIHNVGTIRQANGALTRVITTLKQPDEDKKEGRSMDDPDQDITFREISFGYDAEKVVLKGVDCVIPKNKITAIVGANGSGKSTMFKLLDRLYEPSAGKLMFGNADACEYDLHAWRKTFCLVAQGSPLMEGTVKDNICYGCERPISQDELIKVAKQARVYDFVSALPEGFDTRVAPGGVNFSGGQRQCIAIARAIMNNPDYLLLDEATSNLDAHSERMVMEALEELMQGRTTVIIAHSLTAIRKADHVIILREGKVESSGAPAQVLQATGNYLEKVMARRTSCSY